MKFQWHYALWLLLALPALAGTYLVLLTRAHKAPRYAGFNPAPAVPGSTNRFRPHIPALLMFAGVGALLLSIARPLIVVTSPSDQGTVVLLIDVSLSMAASDVPPTRLEAARAAAITFVKAQPRDVRVGIVAFGGHADVVQSPTLNRTDALAALDRLELQRFTAIGSGLMGALVTLVPTADIGDGYDVFGPGRPPAGSHEAPLPGSRASKRADRTVQPGSYLSAAIILVSDGRGTMGIAPAKAAKMAADLGVRVYTVGVGTLYGGVANVEGWPTIHAEFDEEILKNIADITGGEYFLARNADKLKRIYDTLGRRVIFETKQHEVTALFAALGVALSLAAALLSLSRTR